jgi:GNAT superfamily N-acetyltransferase
LEDIEIIPYRSDAAPFVLDSFTNSLESAAREPGVDWRVYAMSLGAARGWLRSKLEHVRIAVPKGRPDIYVGWALILEGTLHYVYVKHVARKFGVATALLAGDVQRVSITTWPWTAAYARDKGW